MANDFRQFSRNMQRHARDISPNLTKGVRRVASMILQTIVMATPVDTGRSRANWRVSIGAPALNTIESTDPSGSSTISEGLSIINRLVSDTPIYITNNLPYIVPLNQGHSAQAPAGFVETAIDVGIQEAKNIRVLS